MENIPLSQRAQNFARFNTRCSHPDYNPDNPTVGALNRYLGATEGFIAGFAHNEAERILLEEKLIGYAASENNFEILEQQIAALQEKCAGYEAALEHRDAKIVDVIQWIRASGFEIEVGKWWAPGDTQNAKTDAQLYDLYLNELRDNDKPE